jgi:hypothetical protein
MVFIRTSRRTGISLPWPIAIIVGLVWLVIMAAVLCYGLLAWLCLWVWRRMT